MNRSKRAWSSVVPWAAACVSGAALMAALTQPGRTQPAVIATVDVMVVMDGLKEAQALEAQYKARGEALNKQYKEGIAREQALKADLESLPRNDPTFRAKYFDYRKQQFANEADRQAMQAELDDEGGEIRRGLYQKVIAKVQQIAAQARYDLVLLDDLRVKVPEEGSERGVLAGIQMKKVLYRGDALDISRLVIDAMNNDYAARR